MFKSIVLGVLIVVSVVCGTTIVFGTDLVFQPDTHLESTISPNIYLSDSELNQTIIGYESTVDIRNATIHSTCDTETTFLEKYGPVYYFSLKFLWDSCANESIVLKHNAKLITSTASQINIVTSADIFNLLTDHTTRDIGKQHKKLEKSLQKYKIYEDLKSEDIGKYLSYRKKQRKYQESSYQIDIIENIISGRLKKYASPVTWKSLSSQFSKIPNSARPYRASYTDGIHHGWDIDGEIWDEIVAIDDGIILRVVRDFQYEDLRQIEYSGNLTEEQKLQNLDILRGSQVWLKTTKGEVIFYSHLDMVAENISEGDFITRGDRIGTMGITWVPEKWYDDYHLHFEVQVNPYNSRKAGTYDFLDYMKWDWKFKGESFEYILKNQGEVFE